MKTNFVSTHLSDRLYFFFFWYGRGGATCPCYGITLATQPGRTALNGLQKRRGEVFVSLSTLPHAPPPPNSLSQTHIWPETEKRERENDWRLIYTVCMCVRARESASADFCSLSLPSTLLIGLIPSTAGGCFCAFGLCFFGEGRGGLKSYEI